MSRVSNSLQTGGVTDVFRFSESELIKMDEDGLTSKTLIETDGTEIVTTAFICETKPLTRFDEFILRLGDELVDQEDFLIDEDFMKKGGVSVCNTGSATSGNILPVSVEGNIRISALDFPNKLRETNTSIPIDSNASVKVYELTESGYTLQGNISYTSEADLETKINVLDGLIVQANAGTASIGVTKPVTKRFVFTGTPANSVVLVGEGAKTWEGEIVIGMTIIRPKSFSK